MGEGFHAVFLHPDFRPNWTVIHVSFPPRINYEFPLTALYVSLHRAHDDRYWLISCYAKDVQTNARNAGVFRSLEAVGQAVSYGINSHAENLFVGL